MKGNLTLLNSAYKDHDSMAVSLTKLANQDDRYKNLPITWLRVMHPKGAGYAWMADALIDTLLG